MHLSGIVRKYILQRHLQIIYESKPAECLKYYFFVKQILVIIESLLTQQVKQHS